MKTDVNDPWSGIDTLRIDDDERNNHFEDSFVKYQSEHTRLADSEEYLEKLLAKYSIRCLYCIPTTNHLCRMSQIHGNCANLLRIGKGVVVLYGMKDRFRYIVRKNHTGETPILCIKYCRLRNLQKGTSKKDLVASLSVVKEDYIARLITSGCRLETEEETELALNPLIRHIAPHLQALTATELVHLLKADVLQVVTEAEENEAIKDKSLTN